MIQEADTFFICESSWKKTQNFYKNIHTHSSNWKIIDFAKNFLFRTSANTVWSISRLFLTAPPDRTAQMKAQGELYKTAIIEIFGLRGTVFCRKTFFYQNLFLYFVHNCVHKLRFIYCDIWNMWPTGWNYLYMWIIMKKTQIFYKNIHIHSSNWKNHWFCQKLRFSEIGQHCLVDCSLVLDRSAWPDRSNESPRWAL